MADLGTRAKPLGEGAQAPLRRREVLYRNVRLPESVHGKGGLKNEGHMRNL